jgi:hypothetical protein
MVTAFMSPFAIWAAIQAIFSSFLWFILGYALAKLGLLKTGALFLIFLALHWAWENWHIINGLNSVLAGGEG